MRTPLLVFIIIISCCTVTASPDNSISADVKLLRFPFPYSAALTVASDTHANRAEPIETAVERFEAVHKLVNTNERIDNGSKEWNLIFKDPEITQHKEWQEGIDGFGLPLSDNFWLYDPYIGVFDHFNPITQTPVPHSCQYGDYRNIIDRWFLNGWIDGLHTGGQGFVPREATRLGLLWLKKEPYRKVTVWIDHALGKTPSCIEPDVLKALPFLLKNLTIAVSSSFRAIGAQSIVVPILKRFGAGGLATKSAFLSIPPGQQRFPIWFFAITLLGSFLAIGLCTISGRFRKLRNYIVSVVVFGSSVLFLAITPIQYAQGDNPGSPYYCLDLVKDAGVDFFWPVQDAPGCKSLYNTLALPEIPYGQRSSFLRIITMDDGTQVMAFPRTYRGLSGFHSLEMLNDDALENLCTQHRSSILYTHWVVSASKVFTAKGLKGLEALKHFYDAGKIWVAPTNQILRFEFIRTFLRFSTHHEGDLRVIEIEGVESPINGLFTPTIGDLSGISFGCMGDGPVEIRLVGKTVKPENLEFSKTDSSVIVQFQGISNRPPLTR